MKKIGRDYFTNHNLLLFQGRRCCYSRLRAPAEGRPSPQIVNLSDALLVADLKVEHSIWVMEASSLDSNFTMKTLVISRRPANQRKSTANETDARLTI